jgi:hypothetical protein
MIKNRMYLLLLLIFSTSVPSMASVCITAQNPKIYAYSMLEADFNNDGISDQYEIVDEYSIISLSQDGAASINTYNIHETWAITEGMLRSNYGIPTEIIGTDADNDGFEDVIAAFGSKIVIRINRNSGNIFESSQFLGLSDLYGSDELPISDSMAKYNSKLAVMDINKDGYSDLIVVHAKGISIFLNDEAGNFNHLKNYDIPTILDSEIDSIFVADLDADSFSEIIINAWGSYIVYFDVALNMNTVKIPNQSDKLAPLDFDGDGDLDFTENNAYDICQIPPSQDEQRYWINKGNGVFEKMVVSIDDTDYPAIEDGQIPGGQLEISSETPDQSGGGSIDYFLLCILVTLIFKKSLTYIRRHSIYLP